MVLKRLFILFLILDFLCGNATAWGKKSSSSAPATVSAATTKAEKKAEAAKQSADNAKKHAETVMANLESSKVDAEVKKARSESAKATANAAAAKKAAADAVLRATAAGTPAAKKAMEAAEQAAREAEAAALEAALAASAADRALDEYRKAKNSSSSAYSDYEYEQSLYEEAEALLAEAIAADAEYTKAWEEYKESRKKVEEAIKKLEEDRNIVTESEYESLVKDFMEKEEASFGNYAKAAVAADASVTAYKKLGNFYKETGYTGDPVFVGTGDYSAEYVDYVAQDYLDKFKVERNYSSLGYEESFGKNWSCSLDTRIIRCNFKDYEGKKKLIQECLDLSIKMRDIFEAYDRNYPSYPRSETAEYYSYADSLKSTMQSELVEVQKIIDLRNYLLEKNKFATYGRYKNPESYYGYSKQLIFLDEQGNPWNFKYEGNGNWVSAGNINKGEIKIYCLDESGKKSFSENTDGGYEVCYSTGGISFYDRYGILYKKIDRNGNEEIYKSKNGRINEIVLKTGEHIYIERNSNNYITKIYGNISGSSYYSYEGVFLKTVMDNENIKLKYDYSDNLLIKISKADDNCIQIKYEYNNYKSKYVCSEVIDENKRTEFFQYYFENKKVKHITHGGKVEEYRLNDYGNPTYVLDQYGNENIIETDSNSMIIAFSYNGNKRYFSYDSLYRPISITYENGGKTTLSYINCGTGTYLEKITDSDGYSNHYFYDSKGNLIYENINDTNLQSYSYNSAGLPIQISNNEKTIEYEYNQYGSLLKETEKLITGDSFSRFYEYDEKNRLIRKNDSYGLDVRYTYFDNYKIETTSKLKKTIFYDNRKRVIKEEREDFISGKKDVREYEYDGCGNIIKVFLNGNLYEESEYFDDEIKSHTIWEVFPEDSGLIKQGIKKSFFYDEKGKLVLIEKDTVKCAEDLSKSDVISLESEKSVTKLSYNMQSRNVVMSVTNSMGIMSRNTYDRYGRVIKEEFSNGYVRNTIYTKAGRISSINDSDYMLWEYKYKNDGSYDIYISLKAVPVEKRNYDINGNLKVLENGVLGKVYYYYKNNKLIEEKTSEYSKIADYDFYNRKMSYSIIKRNGLYNDSRLKEILGYHIEYFNSENRIAAYESGNEESFFECKLDGVGRATTCYDKNGITEYEYDCLDRIIKRIDGNKYVTEFYYDPNDLVCFVLYPDNQKRTVIHNVDGFEIAIIENNHYLKKANYNPDENRITYADCFGNQSIFYYNEHGIITKENILRTGTYDYKNKVYNNKIINTGSLIKDYADNIICAQNTNSKLIFEYDSMSRMVSQEDFMTDSKVEYEYDRFGRCISKILENVRINYSYDECGNISRVFDDRENFFINFKYDCYGREIEKSYWNGFTENMKYNDFGLMESKIITDKLGQVVNADILIYEDSGRLSYHFDKDGYYEHYVYNEKGQLVQVEYPYSEEIYLFNKNSAYDFGLIYDENPEKNISYLDNEILTKVYTILNELNLYSQIKIQNNQNCWTEKFTYTDEGFVKTVRNNITELIYSYDDNHLVNVYCDRNKNEGMSFYWNENGCLSEISGIRNNVKLCYGDDLRITSIECIDNQSLDAINVQYSYDGLGRRTLEKYNNEVCISNLYDGLSYKILQTNPIYNNSLSNYFQWEQTKLDSSNVYRYVNDDSYTAYGSDKYSVDSNKKNVKNKSYDFFNDISFNVIVNGKIVAANKNGEWTSLLKDYRNRDLLTYNSDYSVTSRYDIYGNNYFMEYNFFDCIKNVGKRDYVSILKTFTSEDPIHDGVNWYAYCSGDPVNYHDVNGYQIIPVPQTYLMTDPVYKDIITGNSKNINDGINKVGCYITCYANAMCELYGLGVVDADKVKYTSVFGINNDKSLFSTQTNYEANLIRNKSMNNIFTSSNDYATVTWDYFTREISGDLTIKVELAKAYALQDDYVVMGVFDLSDSFDNIDNHMVIINDMFDDSGVFEDITYSSINDLYRQSANPEAYCVDNLKEIRVVKVENKNCSK